MAKRRTRSEGGDQEQDVELNIASIVDCFTVLITYMLAAASFITVGALEAGIASRGESQPDAGAETAPPPIVLLELGEGNVIRIRTAGQVNKIYSFPPGSDGKWKFDEAFARVRELKIAFPSLNSLTLVSDNAVKYGDIVRAVATTKRELPVFFVKAETL